MRSQQPVEVVTPAELYHQLIGNQQLALIDVREIRPYSQGHLLFAIPLPLGRLELMVADLIPCRAAAIVICDGGSADTDNLHLGMRAARRLAELGYTNIQLLEDGICGWQAAGYELFEGVNVPSKAFGEFIEEREQTPSISPQELKAMQDQGADMVLLDSRPEEEFQMLSVPGGICCPGGELAYRVHDIVPSEDTTVVVNCAGRTRSIIGCQSLINASIPNRVVALRNGVMGWHLAGYQVAHGCTDKVSPPSLQALQKAQQSARRLIERFAVQTVSLQTLNQWRTERDTNSLYILDVRTLEEFEQQRLVDAVHAPGGQLVQNTDLYVGVRNARLVLVDSEMVRGVFAASWLMQMGKDNIFVLEQGWQQSQSLSGEREKPVLGLEQLNCDQITAADLQSALQDSGVQILDVNLSEDYQKGHIEGAWFVPRARLAMAVKHIPPADLYVLTSSDGITASLTAAELTAVTEVPVKVLACGNRGWEAAGNTLVCGQGNRSLEPDDRWQIPFLPDPVTGKSAEQNMREYLSWEVALVEQIQRDGTTNFRHFPED